MYSIDEAKEIETLWECLDLGRQQFEEVVGDHGDVKWNLHKDMLELIFKSGLIHLVVARDESLDIIGYFCNIINLDLFTSVYKARDIGIFVHPDHRKSGVFKDMLAKMEDILIDHGVKAQELVFQKGHNEKMPLKFGYEPFEVGYQKFLGE